MRLRLVKEAFDHPDYLFELKHDGFRALAYIEKYDCRLVSRNLRTLPFKSLSASLAMLPVASAILDGEIVVLDSKGVSQFNALLPLKGREAAVFYAFDLIWTNGTDLRRIPLEERKAWLRELVRGSACPRLLYAQHIAGAGMRFFKEICNRDLEGVVAKRRRGLYREDRPDWLKIKNRSYSQAEGRNELLTGTRLSRGRPYWWLG
jgi:bifunctional non-homologous end joining protein LigD